MSSEIREQAIKWWNNLTIEESIQILKEERIYGHDQAPNIDELMEFYNNRTPKPEQCLDKMLVLLDKMEVIVDKNNLERKVAEEAWTAYSTDMELYYNEDHIKHTKKTFMCGYNARQDQIDQLERDRLDAGHDICERDVTISELQEEVKRLKKLVDGKG